MFLCYIDEAGDDGYPVRSSDLFAFTMLYMNRHDWKANWEKVREFRRVLRDKYSLPVKLEFHTKQFITDKNPYREFGYSITDKRRILAAFLRLINSLEVRIINVVIDKTKIKAINPDYDVFDRALTYAIQRIENDLVRAGGDAKFMLISDEGRLAKTVKTARRVQQFNYINSMFSETTYRKDITRLIEDPMSKSSTDSWFIQLADLIVTVVYYYKLLELGIGTLPKRVENTIKPKDFDKMLGLIGNRLNTKASRHCKYGIVTYPK